ncbi:hypothetical protein M2140_002151 [Clostridiales Family XIII bacterium PM5-7]
MSFKEMSESQLLYVLAGAAILLVTLVTLYYLVAGYKHAIACGVSKEKLMDVVKSSVTFSIVPSIAVMAGLVTLVAVIGIPYAWLRLSVLGSVAYELMASNMALSALNLDLATADGYAFGLVMWTMCVGITLPLILNVFMCRKVHQGAQKLGDKDVKWGQISQTTFMSGLLIALVVPMFGKGIVEFITFLVSGGIAILISVIVKKTGWGWLGGFTLAISMIGAMAASVGLDKLFN